VAFRHYVLGGDNLLDRLKPVSNETLSGNVADQLIELILSGDVAPGEKLPTEKEMMKIFDVGRSSIREATRALSVLGLIEVRVPEGMFVAKAFSRLFTHQLEFMNKMSPINREELVEVRKKIEVDIVELATEKATDEDIESLRIIIEQMRYEKDPDEQSRQDHSFHLTLGRMCRNPFLFQIMLLMKDSMMDWIHSLWFERKGEEGEQDNIMQNYFVQHERIYQAVAARDVKLASKAMEEHMFYVGSRFITMTRERS